MHYLWHQSCETPWLKRIQPRSRVIFYLRLGNCYWTGKFHLLLPVMWRNVMSPLGITGLLAGPSGQDASAKSTIICSWGTDCLQNQTCSIHSWLSFHFYEIIIWSDQFIWSRKSLGNSVLLLMGVPIAWTNASSYRREKWPPQIILQSDWTSTENWIDVKTFDSRLFLWPCNKCKYWLLIMWYSELRLNCVS